MRRYLTLALGSVLLATPVAATEMTHAPTGVAFNLPDGWDTISEAEGEIELRSPGQDLVLFLLPVSATSRENFVAGIAPALRDIVSDASVSTTGSVRRAHGLERTTIWARGGFQGEHVDLEVWFVAGGARSLAVVAIGDARKNRVAVERILRSMRKMEVVTPSERKAERK